MTTRKHINNFHGIFNRITYRHPDWDATWNAQRVARFYHIANIHGMAVAGNHPNVAGKTSR